MTTGAVAFFKFPCEGEAAAMMTAAAIARTAEGLAALSTTPAADPWRMEVCAAECGERAGNAGAGRGAWVGGLRAKTCAICRLAHRQSRLRWQQGGGIGGRLGGVMSLVRAPNGQEIGTVNTAVEEDAAGVSTPTVVPAEDEGVIVDGDGVVFFPEEFSGCFDHGDSDDFRASRRIDCVHAGMYT